MDGLNSRMEEKEKRIIELKGEQQKLPSLKNQKIEWKKKKRASGTSANRAKGLTFCGIRFPEG